MAEHDKYYKSVDKLVQSMEAFIQIAKDPYKAPEQLWPFWPDVLNSSWNAQIEYGILNKKAEVDGDVPTAESGVHES